MSFSYQSRINRGADDSLFVRAPAKVNLFLHVTGRREDGYHVLESLFVFTKRGDLLRFHQSKNFELTITGPFADQLRLEPTEQNLVARAAKALADFAGIECCASIELEKNLPLASGLGGGSADAAATLIGLNQLWRLSLTQEQLADIAKSLGADVPACLSSAPQLVRGIGDELTPANLPWSAGIVIVNPLKAVSTPEVFSGFKRFRDGRGLPPFDIAISDLEKVVADIRMIDVLTANSLQDPAVQLCAEIMEIERFLRLNSQHELVRMSGSGGSVFALYHDRQAAEAVARRVREQYPNWWIMADEIETQAS